MRKLIVFNHITTDGFFVDANNSMAWAKADGNDDAEWNAFVAENTQGGGPLIFGRVTYELMAGYWPTPMAAQQHRGVAERMNAAPKVVFSRTLEAATWSNTRLVKTDLVAEIRRMKQEEGEGMAILGSGTITSQLAEAGLIDEYQLVVNPVILGKGRSLFESVKHTLPLKLVRSRAFGNGNVFVSYEPKG